MRSIIGFELVEISAKKLNPGKRIQIHHGVKIKDVKKQENMLSKDSSIIRINFQYNATYEPNVAKVLIEGNLFVLVDNEQSAEILKQWEENKKLKSEFLEYVLNYIMQKAVIETINIASKLNLPSPVPLPKVKVTSEESKDKSEKASKDSKKQRSSKK